MSKLDEIKALQAQIEYAHRDGDPLMEISDLLGKLFTVEHTDWLIHQAERVEELEKEYQVSRTELLEEHIERLERENHRYKQALKTSSEELYYVLNSNKSDEVKLYYINNAKRFMDVALEEAD